MYFLQCKKLLFANEFGYDEIYDYPLDYFVNNKLIQIKIIQRDPSKRIKNPNDRRLKTESKLEARKTSTYSYLTLKSA